MTANKIMTAGILALTLLFTSGVQAREAARSADGPKWLRDPFRYVTVATNNQRRSVQKNKKPDTAIDNSGLKGIFVRNGSYQALYDGQMVVAGEKLGNVLIREITLYSITIEDGAGRRRIDLFHEK